MQAAVLQAERQDNIKSIRFPDYIPPPEPNDDLRQLAKALGGFSDSLGTLTDTGIKFEKQREEDAKLHAESCGPGPAIRSVWRLRRANSKPRAGS